MTKRMAYLMSTALLAWGGFAAPSAQANYVVTFEQSNGNVLESGSGTFDLTGLSRIGQAFSDGSLVPQSGWFSSGFEGQQIYLYAVPITDPVIWGPGGSSSASSIVGDPVRINVRGPYIGVSPDYVSGQSLFESSIYSNSSFSSLGLDPGTYVENWGTGATAGSFTVIVRSTSSPVPEPSTWVMMLIGLAGLGVLTRRTVISSAVY